MNYLTEGGYAKDIIQNSNSAKSKDVITAIKKAGTTVIDVAAKRIKMKCVEPNVEDDVILDLIRKAAIHKDGLNLRLNTPVIINGIEATYVKF